MTNKLPYIRAFNKCSETGLNLFAPSIFIGGCNLKCPYCMNAELAQNKIKDFIPLEDIRKWVREDESEVVMISGGEPTCLLPDLLENLIFQIKSWGCKVAIATNGTNSYLLRKILPNINYVAMDIKVVRNEDHTIIGCKSANVEILTSKAFLSEEKIKREDFNYEIRTTLYPPFIDKESIKEIGSVMRKDDVWVLQQFRPVKGMINLECQNVSPYNEKEVNKLYNVASNFSNNVFLRYV